MVAAMTGDPSLSLPDRDEIRLVDVLHALADPVRLRIVRYLADARCEVSCSTIPLPVGKSTASHHFKALLNAGMVDLVMTGSEIGAPASG